MFVTFILFLYIVEAVFCIFEGRGRKKAYSHPKFNYISNAQTNGIVTDGEKGLPLAGVNIYLQKDSVYTQ